MQHWMIAFCCPCVASGAYVVVLVVGVGLGLEEVLVVAEMVLLLLLMLEEVVGLEVGRSAAMTSASMSSKSSSV
jgi:hypothetical protein